MTHHTNLRSEAAPNRMRLAWAIAVLAVVATGVGLGGCGAQVPDSVEGNFKFREHAFTFNNFDDGVSGGSMTPALAARMFGDQAVCASGAGASCVATPAAKAWIEEMNATLHFGHSEGFAVLAQLMAMGKVSPSDFSGAQAASDIPFDNAAIRAELTYWAATQKILSAHANDKKFAAKDVLSFLATALTDKNEGWRMLIAVRDEEGFHAGHAVVPWGYFRGEADGQYFIRIYDPNFPGEERRVEVNVKANTWQYEGSPNPDFPRTYSGTPDNGNLLYFSPVTARLGVLVPPFSDGFSAAISNGQVLVEGDDAEVGFKNGALVEKGGSLVPGAADCFCKAPSGVTNVLVSGNGPKTITVGADAGTIYATSSNLVAKVEGSSGGAMTVDPTTKQVSYNSTSDGGTTITTTTKNADGSQTTVTVTVDKSTAGITIDSSDPNNIKVTSDVKTSDTSIFVTTTVTKPDGSETTTTAKGRTSNGNDAEFTVNAVAGTTTVNTNVNYAVCKNTKKDPMESDIDCGAFCGMQDEHFEPATCGLGKKCKLDTDCAAYWPSARGPLLEPGPGYCTPAGVCDYVSCEDGRKNGPETAVDCGGGCPCQEGQPCTATYQCLQGLSCIDGACHGATAHPLKVVGVDDEFNVGLTMTLDGQTLPMQRVSGRARGAAFNYPFVLAYTSLTVSVDGGGNYRCAFDQKNGSGQWVWDRVSNPAAFENTLRCSRIRVTARYNSGSTGCTVTDYRFDAGFTISAIPTDGPKMRLTSLSPAITATNWLNPIGNSRLDQGFGDLAISTSYDGGLAYSIAIDGPTVVPTRLDYNPYNPAQVAAAATITRPRYLQTCTTTATLSGSIAGSILVPVTCVCQPLGPDGGVITDGGTGTDAGTDAGTTDAGTDAGTTDAGADAGTIDAGTDAGTPDAGTDAGTGGAVCTADTDCAMGADCYCGDNSGNCAGNTGHCGAGKFATSTPTTDGVASSGQFTVPAGCTQLRVSAWGAAGGSGAQPGMFPIPQPGGAGGHVAGTLAVTPGDKLTIWVGQAGDVATNFTTNEGNGSYLGTPALGGKGDGLGGGQGSGGSGGGLTSIRHANASNVTIQSFSVPGGGGSGSSMPGKGGGGTGSGTHTTRSGEDAPMMSTSGGGGAGDNGGIAGVMDGDPGQGGAFGTLPSGLTSSASVSGIDPAGTAIEDYTNLCNGNAGQGVASGTAGDGCVVLRCLP